MRKTWWVAFHGILLALVGLFSIISLIQSSNLNTCNNNLTELYQEEDRILFESQHLYNWMHYLHTLKVGELAENDTEWAIKYKDDARNVWDDISNKNQEKQNKSIEIKGKQLDCNSIAYSAQKWLIYSLLGYLVVVFVSLKVYQKTRN